MMRRLLLAIVVVWSSGAIPHAQGPVRLAVRVTQHDTADQGGMRVAYSLREKLQKSAIYTTGDATARFEIVLTSVEPCPGQSVVVAIMVVDRRYLGHTGYVVNMAAVADRGPDVAADSILSAFDKLLHPAVKGHNQ